MSETIKWRYNEIEAFIRKLLPPEDQKNLYLYTLLIHSAYQNNPQKPEIDLENPPEIESVARKRPSKDIISKADLILGVMLLLHFPSSVKSE
ncbi:MAG: hypothetical protein ABII10_00705 [Candidatus Paceibacterota bacterium]